jgi:hypothetical protein
MAKGIHCADHATPSACKKQHYFASSGSQSAGIVCLWAKTMEFTVYFIYELNLDRRILNKILYDVGNIAIPG